MEFQQRAAGVDVSIEASVGERLWLSGVVESPVEPTAGDSYVVVDESDEGVLEIVVASWPKLDPLGRLAFSGRRRTVAVSEAELSEVLDRRRQRSGETKRPVRIGDAFLVRGRVTNSPSKWPQIVDVTSFARAHAKIAFHAAVAPRTTVREAKALKLDSPPPAPEVPVPEAANVALPAV